MKKNKNLYFMSIFCLLSTVLCIYRGDGPFNSFRIYNNRSATINVEVEVIAHGVSRFTIPPGPDYKIFGGFSTKKKKPSEEARYVKITEEDGTVLFDLRGEALDIHFKKVEEESSFNTYRLDVN